MSHRQYASGSPVRILFCPAHVVYSSRRGSEIGWAFDLVDRLARRHPGSVVVTGRCEEGGLPYRVVEVQRERRDVNLTPRASAEFTLRCGIAANKLARRHRFDVVHHVLPFALGKTQRLPLRGALIPTLIGPVQTPLGYRGADERGAGGPYLLDIVQPVSSWVSDRRLRSAGHVVAIDEEAARLVTERGVSGQRVTVLPPGVDTRRWSPGDGGPHRDGTFRLLSATTFTSRKAGDLLLRALQAVVTRCPRAHLTLLGNGPAIPILRALVDALGLAGHVSIHGRVGPSELVQAYRSSDLLVSMSRAESFASVGLEALACGLPMVATRVGGFRDAIRDGVEGHLIDVDDVDAMADRIGDLAADRRMLDNMGSAARRRAVSAFDWDGVIVPAYERLLSRLANAK